MDLNDIKYGTLPLIHINSIKNSSNIIRECENVGILDYIFNNPPPANDSDTTRDEILQLHELTQNATENDYTLCNILEYKHYHFFAKFCNELGILEETEKSIKYLSEEFDGLVNYIKFKVNRPRPHQLALYYNIPLSPIILTNANSPSWPSGHTIDFLVILHKLKKKYPSYLVQFDDMYNKLRYIRELSGVHYRSDTIGGELLFSLLVENKLI